MTGDRLRIIVGALVAAAAALAVTAAAIPDEQPDTFCQSRVRQGVVGSGPVVRVVGDSYTQGYGLADEAQAWPTHFARRVHARVSVDGFGGSGYTNVSPCAGARFDERVPGRASLLIIEGGVNDTDASAAQIREGLRRVVAAAQAPLVLVGPTAAPMKPAAARRVDRILSREADRLRVRYVSVIDLRLPYLADGLHLTERGHRQYAATVAEALS